MSTITELLEEAGAKVQLLTDNLPNIVDPASISLSAKIPFKVICYREAILWRTEELSRCAYDMYRREEIVAGAILTRAVIETAAAVWYLMNLVQKQIDCGVAENLDNKVMKLLMGDKTNDEMPMPVHVIDMVREADKSIPGIMSRYESLSEYAHPNWLGASCLYSKIDHNKILTNFGKNIRSVDGQLKSGLLTLLAALGMFEYAYNKTTDLMPEFISICEEALKE